MQPMATRLGVDHQQLQQFVTSLTWDYVVAPGVLRHHMTPSAGVVVSLP
jgi:hypothetical protein